MTPSVDYRPQWFSPTPAGYRDEVFHYAFDGTNTPGLASSLNPQSIQENIPLPLQAGSEFIWRAYAVFPNVAYAAGLFWLRFKDPFGNYLSAGYVSMDLYSYASGLFTIGAPTTMDKIPIPLEPEILCPSAGLITVDLSNQNPSGGNSLQGVGIVLYGLKRVKV